LERPPSLRWALLGGGPIAPALLERAAAAEVPVAPSYGMTEACSQIATGGRPLPGVEIRLASDGEVLVRGATVSAGALSAGGWRPSRCRRLSCLRNSCRGPSPGSCCAGPYDRRGVIAAASRGA